MSAQPSKLPFDIVEVYGDITEVREENFALTNESTADKLKPGTVRARLLTDFIFVKHGEFAYPEYNSCTPAFWKDVEVYGFMMMPGTSGDGKWFAWSLLWYLNWPSKHFELVRITDIQGISLERSVHYRNGHEPALFLNTARQYSYTLLEPDETIHTGWLQVLKSWSKVERKLSPIPLPKPIFELDVPPPWWRRQDGKPGNEGSWQRLVREYNRYHEEQGRSEPESEPEPKAKLDSKAGGKRRESEPSSKGKGKGKSSHQQPARAGKSLASQKRRRSGDFSSDSPDPSASETESPTSKMPSCVLSPAGQDVPERSSRPVRKARPVRVQINTTAAANPTPTPAVHDRGRKTSRSIQPPPATEAADNHRQKRQKVMSVEHLAPPTSLQESATQKRQSAKQRMQQEANLGSSDLSGTASLSSSPSAAAQPAGPPSGALAERPDPCCPERLSSAESDADGSPDMQMVDASPLAETDSYPSSVTLSQSAKLAGAVRQLSIAPEGGEGPTREATSPDGMSSQQTETGTAAPPSSPWDILGDLMFPLTQRWKQLSSSPDRSQEARGERVASEAATAEQLSRGADAAEFNGETSAPPTTSASLSPPSSLQVDKSGTGASEGTASLAAGNAPGDILLGEANAAVNPVKHSVISLHAGGGGSQSLENRSSSRRSRRQCPQGS